MYKVLDNTGHILRIFSSYKEAYTYKLIMGRLDWKIKTGIL